MNRRHEIQTDVRHIVNQVSSVRDQRDGANGNDEAAERYVAENAEAETNRDCHDVCVIGSQLRVA